MNFSKALLKSCLLMLAIVPTFFLLQRSKFLPGFPNKLSTFFFVSPSPLVHLGTLFSKLFPRARERFFFHDHELDVDVEG